MNSNSTGSNLSKIVKIGVLSAMSFALMYLEFPIFSAYPWLKLDFADVPALFGAFSMGPAAGVMIEAIKNLLNFIFKSSTGGVGELANFTLAAALVLPAGLIYKRKKSKKTAIIGLSVGSLCMIAVAPALNYFVLLPLFIAYLPADFDIGLYLVAGVLPITAIKAVSESLATGVLYKRLSKILHK